MNLLLIIKFPFVSILISPILLLLFKRIWLRLTPIKLPVISSLIFNKLLDELILILSKWIEFPDRYKSFHFRLDEPKLNKLQEFGIILPLIFIFPLISNFSFGIVEPIPILPVKLK